MYHFLVQKKNHPKLAQICNYGICSKGPKNEFETAVVNKLSVFKPLKFCCKICETLMGEISWSDIVAHKLDKEGISEIFNGGI